MVDPTQLPLPLDDNTSPNTPTTERQTVIGHSSVTYSDAKSILTQPAGFMDAYDFTLNPYSGCSFGCTYCYVAGTRTAARQLCAERQWNMEAYEQVLAILKAYIPQIGEGKAGFAPEW